MRIDLKAFGKKEGVQATFYTGLQVGVKMLVNVVLGKLVAVFVGASGLFVIGQFQSLYLMVQNFSNGATHNGVVSKVVASNNAQDRQEYFKVGYLITVIASITTLIVGIACSRWINNFMFPEANYGFYVVLAFLVTPFVGFFQFLLSVTTASKNLKLLTTLQVLAPICMLTLVLVMLWFKVSMGILLGILVFPIPVAIASIIWFHRRQSEFSLFKGLSWDQSKGKILLRYSIMTLLSVLSISLYQIVLRDLIGTHLSADDAGYFDAMLRISNLYIFFISMLFGNYFIPKLAGANHSTAASLKAILQVGGFNLGFILLVALVLLTLAPFLIPILFTPEFVVIVPFLKFMILANGLKFLFWVFTNFLMTLGKVVWFSLLEIASVLGVLLFLKFGQIQIGIKNIFLAEALSFSLLIVLAIPLVIWVLKKQQRVQS